MTKQIEAVYENGVLRPVQPIELSEGEHLDLILPGRQATGRGRCRGGRGGSAGDRSAGDPGPQRVPAARPGHARLSRWQAEPRHQRDSRQRKGSPQ